MGFDINNFGSMISNLGKASANMQNDKTKIDTKSELNAYVSGWDAIKASAEKAGAEAGDIASLEGTMQSELASLMGAEFGQSAGVKKTADGSAFSADEISLENMMSLLEPEDGLDIGKLREYNKQPVATIGEAVDGIIELTEAGFDNDLIQVMLDETPGAFKHITNAIKNGSANRISNGMLALTESSSNTENVDTAGQVQEYYLTQFA
ncbi:MAG: hypothetical protein NC200_04105 [Candidatus Gastranaerophilales bacterium]|nr:hypothetical protein [Candidatus Gastranaerophilales bacterium]